MTQDNSAHPQWANATPAGLVALAVACFCFFALLSGKVSPAAVPLMGCWLLGGFVIQLFVGLLDLKSNNSTGGNTFMFFAAFFMLVGGIEMLAKYDMGLKNIPFDGRLDGWAWSALALTLIAWTPAFFKTPLPLIAIIVLLDIAVVFLALIDLGAIGQSLTIVPAWSLLFTGIVAVYFSGALIVNTAFGKPLYPIPGPIAK